MRDTELYTIAAKAVNFMVKKYGGLFFRSIHFEKADITHEVFVSLLEEKEKIKSLTEKHAQRFLKLRAKGKFVDLYRSCQQNICQKKRSNRQFIDKAEQHEIKQYWEKRIGSTKESQLEYILLLELINQRIEADDRQFILQRYFGNTIKEIGEANGKSESWASLKLKKIRNKYKNTIAC